MRRILIAVLLIVTTLGVWAEGNREQATGTPEPVTLRIFWSGDAVPPEHYTLTPRKIAEGLVSAAHPGTRYEYTAVDLSTGADKTMRAEVAAGNAPDVYIDTWVRAASYLRADFALDLRNYMSDLQDYLPGVLDATTRNGAVLGLSQPGDGQAMAVNLDMCAEVGFAPADWATWTIAEFYDLAARVKARYGGKKWVTGLFAGNQSGDYLIRNWAASFGAEFYRGGNYSRTTINSDAGVATLDFLADLAAKGYVRQDWPMQVDDDYVLDWARGKIATAPFFYGWIEPYFQTVEQEGGARFNYAFVPFPRAPGVERVGAFYTGGGIVVPKQASDSRNKLAAAYAQAFNSPESQLVAWTVGNVRPNRRSVVERIGKAAQFDQVSAVIAANGLVDFGQTAVLYKAETDEYFPVYSPTRPLFPQALQKLAGGASPTEVMSWYEAEVNRILAGE